MLGGQPFGTSNNDGSGSVSTLAGDVAGPSNDNVIQPLVVTTGKIANGAVTSGKLAPEAVTLDKMAPDSVGSSQLLDDSVDNDKITDNAVHEAQIQDGAVTTDKIADEAVTQDKIAIDAVGSEQIADGAVLNARLASECVTPSKMQQMPEGSYLGRAFGAGDGEPQFIETLVNLLSSQVLTGATSVTGPTWTAEDYFMIHIQLLGSIQNGAAAATNMTFNANADVGNNYAHSLIKCSTTTFFDSGGVGDNAFAAAAGYNNSTPGAFICNIWMGAKTNGFARVAITEASHFRNAAAAAQTITRGGFSWQNTATPLTTFVLNFLSGADFTGIVRVWGIR